MAVIAVSLAWGTAAIAFSPLPAQIRPWLVWGFPFVSLAVLILVRPRRKALLCYCLLFILVLSAWLSMQPSNHRNWQADVAELPYGVIDGDRITIHNIRNIDYRTETDYTVRHYDRTFHLSQLRSIDLFLSDWGLKTIVHTILSFGFADGSYLCVSVETRKEVGEEYSAVRGFFRNYELTYVVADERDLIRLRTNYRKGETVYLYRLGGSPPAVAREIFLDYVRYINRLRERPEWYNALLGNCTTQIRGHTRPYAGKVWWDWRLLANGYVDEMAYEIGVLDQSLPFAELKQRSVINPKALAAGSDPDFSRRIREGLPGMD
ncbi:MAG: DUF4105 domain-containing protein [Desulfobulbaceae bacterium]|nr:MAG: DUF4105 domain-containing protein [Desulfobulbaceae bacterium]